MRISFVVNDISFLKSHRLALVQEAVTSGWEVHILSNTKEIEGFPDGVHFHSLPIHRSSLGVLSNGKLLWRLITHYRNIQPDMIHHITLKPIVFGSFAARWACPKASIINAVTGLGYLFTENRSPLGRLLLWGLRTISPAKAHYVFQNSVDRAFFQTFGLGKNNTLIKGSGVDAQQFTYSPPPHTPTVRILFTGRILKDKGVIELLQACTALLDKGLPLELKILGRLDPHNPAHITQEALESYAIPNKIVWEGFSTQIKEELQNCHIYCLPSYREGLPKSIVEAMAIGRPIVTTDAPGCSDCVQEGRNGFKVPIKDTQQLAEKLELLINDPQLREQMGITSRKLFEKEYTLAQVVQQHMQLYDKLRTFENKPL